MDDRKRKVLALGVAFLELEDELNPPSKKKIKRTVWVRDWIKRREQRSIYNNLLRELRVNDRANYKKWLRMTPTTFESLLQMVGPYIQKNDTILRESIPPAERLGLTLRYLATGESMISLSFQFRIGRSTISNIIPETCEAIYDALKQEYLKVPATKEEWKTIAEMFEKRWNFPNCIGALDGKHVVFTAPRATGSYFQNYKGTKSIVLMALADANYRFTYIDVGTNGRVSDGGVWNKTNFKEVLENGSLNIPEDEPLPKTNTKLPYVIVADEAFALKKYLMKPYSQSSLDDSKRIFNYRLSRARRIVENVFGILVNRWLILRSAIPLHYRKVSSVTLACCALHNFLVSKSKNLYIPSDFVDQENPETGKVIGGAWRSEPESQGLRNLRANDYGKKPTNNATSIRDEFKEYFNTVGQVAFQWKKIYD